MVTGESENMAASEDEASGRFSRVAAAKFSTKWAGTVDEQQNSQAFWQDFFREVVGIKDLQEAGIEFEKKVVSSKKGTTTRIDVYWRETLLVEQKSAGKDLEAAEVQAREYVVSLPPAQRPPVIVICDFVRFRIVDILLNNLMNSYSRHFQITFNTLRPLPSGTQFRQPMSRLKRTKKLQS
jgi:hypothetical protein